MRVITYALIIVAVFQYSCNDTSATEHKFDDVATSYQCVPCGSECDKEVFKAPGSCPHCEMKLVEKTAIGFSSVEANDICAYIRKHPDAILLDVRTPEEFAGKADPDFGTLKNAINLPIQQLPAKLYSMEKYKNREILVYCSHSHRSPQVAYMLTQNGFSKVANMEGGLSILQDRSCLIQAGSSSARQ